MTNKSKQHLFIVALILAVCFLLPIGKGEGIIAGLALAGTVVLVVAGYSAAVLFAAWKWPDEGPQ